MTATAALAELRAAGVRVRLDDHGTIALEALAPPPPDVLAFARRHRAGIAELLRLPGATAAPDMPLDWCEGVALLATMPPPHAIPPPRWAALAATSASLLRDHGAELHRIAWDVLDVFGLHYRAPAVRSDCMGVAWLLSGRVIASIVPDAVRIVVAGGHTLRAGRMGQHARLAAVPAWALSEGTT